MLLLCIEHQVTGSLFMTHEVSKSSTTSSNKSLCLRNRTKETLYIFTMFWLRFLILKRLRITTISRHFLLKGRERRLSTYGRSCPSRCTTTYRNTSRKLLTWVRSLLSKNVLQWPLLSKTGNHHNTIGLYTRRDRCSLCSSIRLCCRNIRIQNTIQCHN